MSRPTRLDRQQLDILRACCKPESDDEDHVAHARLWQLIFRHVDALEAERDELAAALREITKKEGRFSADPLEHCANCIDDMAHIAEQALAKVDTTQKPKTFDSVVEMVRDLFPDDPGIVAELERRMQLTEATDG